MTHIKRKATKGGGRDATPSLTKKRKGDSAEAALHIGDGKEGRILLNPLGREKRGD